MDGMQLPIPCDKEESVPGTLPMQPCIGPHQRATLAEAISLGFTTWDGTDWVPDLDRCVKCGVQVTE